MTGIAEQNGLRQLEARIRSLPDQDRLKRLLALFENTDARVRERRDAVRSSLGRIKALRAIQANSGLLAAEEQACVSAAEAKAKELAELVGGVRPDSNKIAAQLEAIKRATAVVNNAITATWRGVRQQYEERVGAVRPLAERLSPQALGAIDGLARLLRSHGDSPPSSVAETGTLIDAIRAFNDAVKSMKIDGPIGKFLRDASSGGADPHALFDPEIRGYLDDHPSLWKALRVELK